jgi:hypothetical protein
MHYTNGGTGASDPTCSCFYRVGWAVTQKRETFPEALLPWGPPVCTADSRQCPGGGGRCSQGWSPLPPMSLVLLCVVGSSLYLTW